MGIDLRSATLEDAELLLGWRNDPATRRACRDDHVIGPKEHERWLRDSLSNPRRKIFIAELRGAPVGTVRYDFDGAWYELSWTVAPGRRGGGVGKEMVRALVAMLSLPVRAMIKPGNTASIRIAEAAGMKPEGSKDGMLLFLRR